MALRWVVRIALMLALVVIGGCGRLGYRSVPAVPGLDAGTMMGADAAHPDAAVEDGSTLSDAGVRDAEPGSIVVSGLELVWTTPNSIAWAWARTGTADAFGSYEFVTALSADEVRMRSGTARVWTSTDNPELGRFVLPDGSGGPVVRTITDELMPSTTYYAALTAIDSAGGRSVTAPAMATTTAAPTREIVVFSNDAVGTWTAPNEYTRSTSGPYAGAACYAWPVDCTGRSTCADPAMCFENLQLGVEVDTSAVPRPAFEATAYYELVVSPGGEEPAWATQLYLAFTSDPTVPYLLDPVTMRAGSYRVYQFPVRVFASEPRELTYAVFSSGFFDFAVGGCWSGGSSARIDEIRVRW